MLAYIAHLEPITMDECGDYLRVCEEAVRSGGQVLQQWAGRIEVRKKGPADLVTQADLLPKRKFVGLCLCIPRPLPFRGGERADRKSSDPGDCPDFRASENGTVPFRAAGSRTEYRWIVDPLDGTTNYVHGVPHYCVSLALERNGELLVGRHIDPVLDECFTAAVGQGAGSAGRPIHTSRVAELSEALAAVGFPPNAPIDAPDVLMFLKMLPRCQAIRRTGSSP